MKIQSRILLGWVVITCGLLAGAAYAHGLYGQEISGAVGVHFHYDGGAAAVDAEVRVYAPGAEQAFAEGMTDDQGRFTFFPDAPGMWRAVVDDGLGHRATLDLALNEGHVLGVRSTHVPHGPHVRDVVTGLGIIFGLFGLWSLWGRRTRK